MEFFKPLSQKEETSLLHEFGAKAETIKVPQPNMARAGTPVSTMVCRGRINGTKYHVPSFADHWGVVVGNMLYHLVYHWSEKRAEFTWERWERQDSPRINISRVGTTHYTHEEISAIGNCHRDRAKLTGDAMFVPFLPYHMKIWNCQIFAKIFLKAVCIEPDVEFDSLTLPDMRRVV
jgi:hypothetical protein